MSESRSTELDQLAAALCAAQAEFVAIPKDSTNPFFKSAYASLPKVVEVASPILTKHGLAVTQLISHDEAGDTLSTWLLHKSGQFIAGTMRLHLTKSDPQGQGSATTYARRYSYMAALGLVADEDDDGNHASRPRAGKAVPERKSTETPQPTARPAQPTERPASAKQRGLLNAKADDAKLSNSEFANAILAATGSEARDFESEEHAGSYLKRALDRLPERLVDPVLEQVTRLKDDRVVA